MENGLSTKLKFLIQVDLRKLLYNMHMSKQTKESDLSNPQLSLTVVLIPNWELWTLKHKLIDIEIQGLSIWTASLVLLIM